MALARLALRNLPHRLSTTTTTSTTVSASTTSLLGLNNVGERSVVQRPKWSEEFMKRFMATSTAASSGGDNVKTTESSKEISVSEGGKKSKGLFRRKKGKKGEGLLNWRRRDQDFVPALWEIFPSGLGNALMQASENINRLFESMNISPFQLMGRVKEQDDCYKLRYEVPGLSKEDVKITVDDGVLTIVGEMKEEEEEESDDESQWSARMYGYYNTSVQLPEDAKVDEIKAELKDGLLNIIIPRTEKPKKDVKEVKVH